MTLAAIFFLCIFYSEPRLAAVAAWDQSAQQSPAEAKPGDSPAPSVQSAAPPAAPAPNLPQKQPAGAKPKSSRQAKKSAPCTPAVATKARSMTGDSTSKETDGGAAASPSAGGPSANKLPPCPPAKVVIRNGGTAETAVQLTGGASNGKDSAQRASIDKLLGSTEDSLKKIGGLTPEAGQQETVKQIQDYVTQSKAALTSGDLELAHNLAMKAHLLANELLKPRT